jgi:hypothetical protein
MNHNLSVKAIELVSDLDDRKMKKLMNLLKIHSSLINAVVEKTESIYDNYYDMGYGGAKTLLAYTTKLAVYQELEFNEKANLTEQLIKKLIELGAKINNTNDTYTILYISLPNEKLFQFFLEKGARLRPEEIMDLKKNPHTYQFDRIDYYESFLEKEQIEKSIDTNMKLMPKKMKI